jgi:predicted helicase
VEDIINFVKSKSSEVKLVFCTYHSSQLLLEATNNSKAFELGIFDEAHKTTGNNRFGLGLEDKHIPIKKRLFMTATPKHYDINRTNKDDSKKILHSMDSEDIYGPRAYTLSFREAIDLGIIVDYKVMISVSSQLKLDNELEIEEKLVSLRKAISKDENISKVITFHRTIEGAQILHMHINDNNAQPNYESLHISSLLPSYFREEVMQSFTESNKAIITNAGCLTEGVDVPAVDMVAFMNKKKSKIDIVQAIGRALRKVPGKKLGYVFLPLSIVLNEGDTLESAIDRMEFNIIWEVIQALSEQDEDLHSTINYIRQEKGKAGDTISGLEKYIDIMINDKINYEL